MGQKDVSVVAYWNVVWEQYTLSIWWSAVCGAFATSQSRSFTPLLWSSHLLWWWCRSRFPSMKELRACGRCDLAYLLRRQGGINSVCDMMDMRPRKYGVRCRHSVLHEAEWWINLDMSLVSLIRCLDFWLISTSVWTFRALGRSERSVEWHGDCCSGHPGLHVRQTHSRKRIGWKLNGSVRSGGIGVERCSQSRQFDHSVPDKFSKRRSKWSTLLVTGKRASRDPHVFFFVFHESGLLIWIYRKQGNLFAIAQVGVYLYLEPVDLHKMSRLWTVEEALRVRSDSSRSCAEIWTQGARRLPGGWCCTPGQESAVPKMVNQLVLENDFLSHLLHFELNDLAQLHRLHQSVRLANHSVALDSMPQCPSTCEYGAVTMICWQQFQSSKCHIRKCILESKPHTPYSECSSAAVCAILQVVLYVRWVRISAAYRVPSCEQELCKEGCTLYLFLPKMLGINRNKQGPLCGSFARLT